MNDIKKTFVVDENNKKIAVQIDLDTYNKIEEILENYALAALMKQAIDTETLTLGEAEIFYKSLEKAE